MIDNFLKILYSVWVKRLITSALILFPIATGVFSLALSIPQPSNFVLSWLDKQLGQDLLILLTIVSVVVTAVVSGAIQTWYPGQYQRFHDGNILKAVIRDTLEQGRQEIIAEAENGVFKSLKDHELKVTLFVVANRRHNGSKKKKLHMRFYTRAGGMIGRHCNHTFDIEGEFLGVAGASYHQGDAVKAFPLADLHPAKKPQKNIWSATIDQYARDTFIQRETVEKEIVAKQKAGRRMPRLLYGLRVWDSSLGVLGVVVVDCIEPSLNIGQQGAIGRLVTVLEAPLKRLQS